MEIAERCGTSAALPLLEGWTLQLRLQGFRIEEEALTGVLPRLAVSAVRRMVADTVTGGRKQQVFNRKNTMKPGASNWWWLNPNRWFLIVVTRKHLLERGREIILETRFAGSWHNEFMQGLTLATLHSKRSSGLPVVS